MLMPVQCNKIILNYSLR